MISRQAIKQLLSSLAFRIGMAVLILYVIYHCVSSFSDRVVTDTVTMGEDNVSVNGEAVIFRDEVVVSVAGGNTLCSYLLEDGAKVNAASTLAQLYTVAGDAQAVAQTQRTLSALDRQIAVAASVPATDSLAALPSLRAQTSDALLSVARYATNGTSMNEIANGAFDVLLSLDRIDALTDKWNGPALTSSLALRRQQLLMSASYSGRTVTFSDVGTDTSGGYFFYGSHVDGYETVFRRAALASMTLTDWNALTDATPTAYTSGITLVGKLVASHRWSIALPVEPAVAQTLAEGDYYNVRFPDEGNVTLSMWVERIIGSADEGQTVAVLTCDVMPSNFSYTRYSRVELILSTTRGYRIPENALVTHNGREGVYTLQEGRVTFLAADILLRADGYVLAYIPTADERNSEDDPTYAYDRYVNVRNVIITEGRDLYDGKYIN